MGKCLYCGKESGKYALCFNCNKIKEKNEITKCEKCGQWLKSDEPCKCSTKKSAVDKEKVIIEKKKDIADNIEKINGTCIACEKDAPKGYLCLDCYIKKEGIKKDLDYLVDSDETKDYYNNLKYNVFKLRRMDYAQNACLKIFAIAEILENKFKIKGYINRSAIAIVDLLKKKKEFLDSKKQIENEEEIPDTSELKEDFKSILNEDVKDYRKIYPMNLHCTDGHYVRSKAEREIDNYLYREGVKHAYEPKYRAVNGQEYYPDFYLADLKLYIEYFGKDDEEYLGKAEKKMELYAQDKDVAFSYLTPKDDNILEDRLEQIIWSRKNELK